LVDTNAIVWLKFSLFFSFFDGFDILAIISLLSTDTVADSASETNSAPSVKGQKHQICRTMAIVS